MEQNHQIQLVKKEAMIVAGKVISHPVLYRIAASTTEISLKLLPRFALYNHLNAWGRHRENPQPVKETFHDWYKKHRSEAAGQETSR
jgi:L-lactate dehydrogenase complex protein LldF